MTNKTSRFAHAFMVEGKKRLPWIIICAVVLFAYAAVQPYYATKDNTRQLLKNTEIIKVQSDQLKIQGDKIQLLSEQNKALNQQVANGNNLILCMIRVPFPDRTDDQVNNCRKKTTASASFSANSATLPEQGSSSPQSTPAENNAQPNNPPAKAKDTPPPDNRGPVKKIIDFVNPFS